MLSPHCAGAHSPAPLVVSVPPYLGPGCQRDPQRPVATLHQKKPCAGGGRAHVPLLVSAVWLISSDLLHLGTRLCSLTVQDV